MKKQVMVVDDSRMMELHIRRLLEGTDYEIVAYCENGEDAIAGYADLWSPPWPTTTRFMRPAVLGPRPSSISPSPKRSCFRRWTRLQSSGM